MTSVKRMSFSDLLTFNFVNFDQLTETYGVPFYGEYFLRWASLQRIAFHPTGVPMGYLIGKCEGVGEDWHGHVSAVTVAPTFRRLGVASSLMQEFETTCISWKTYFVDLFVRASNNLAIDMYKGMGYVQYRKVTGYYAGGGPSATGHSKTPEDAHDMRKAMPRDKERKVSSLFVKKPVISPDEVEWH